MNKQAVEEQKIASSLQNGLKTHCPKGHEYTPENTKILKGRRYCRTCLREYQRKSNAAKRAMNNTGTPRRTRKAKEENALPTFKPMIPEEALKMLFAKQV